MTIYSKMARDPRKQLRRDIANLDYSIAELDLDLAKELRSKTPNQHWIRIAKESLAKDRKKLAGMKKTLKDLGG